MTVEMGVPVKASIHWVVLAGRVEVVLMSHLIGVAAEVVAAKVEDIAPDTMRPRDKCSIVSLACKLPSAAVCR